MPGEGGSDEDIVVRIKADAPVLKPDEPIPVRPCSRSVILIVGMMRV
jgi:hypothetical protein